ncbi:MAG: hypothetical protein WB791_07490 [Waddliaceae bacterium]
MSVLTGKRRTQAPGFSHGEVQEVIMIRNERFAVGQTPQQSGKNWRLQ